MTKIKIPKKKVAAYNKSQTTLETPFKIIPFIDRMTVGLNFTPNHISEAIHSNIWAQLADTTAFPKAAKKGSYNVASRIRIESAAKLKHYPFMQYRYADKCAARLSLSFSPHDLGEGGLDQMHVALKSIVEGGWRAFVESGRVNMIEISADFPGISVDSFRVLPKQTTTMKTWSNGGQLQTLMLGKKEGNQTRIYDRGQKRLSNNQAWTHGEITRVERVLRGQKIQVASLPDMANQFAGLMMVDLPASWPPDEPKGKEYVWCLFCDAVTVRGLPAALKLLPADSYRKRYRKWLKEHPAPWWNPDAIWDGWKPMISKTELASMNWF